MNSRRSFIHKVTNSLTVAAVGISVNKSFASELFSESGKPIRIGIIGAENSHTIGFGKLFNIDKKFPGLEVKYVWGETKEFALDAMEKGGIPNMVNEPLEMIGKIDALIVDHRHGKFHLNAAKPFLKEGIPIFIDKPFCYRLSEGIEFLKMARKYNTPVTSYSSIAHSYKTFDVMEQLKRMKPVNQIVCYGRLDMNSKYGGVFFYGAHLIQPLMYKFGDAIVKVRIHKNDLNSSASLVFENGMMATLIFTTKKYGWQTFIETEEGILELKPKNSYSGVGKNYEDMVTMFRIGKEPRSYKSILSGVAVLEALEKSLESQQWEKVASIPIIE